MFAAWGETKTAISTVFKTNNWQLLNVIAIVIVIAFALFNDHKHSNAIASNISLRLYVQKQQNITSFANL